jgi:protease I
MPYIAMLVAPANFRDEELLGPRAVFERHGYDVKIVSKNAMEPTAKGSRGATVDIDMDVKECKAADCVAVVFVGGQGSKIFHLDRAAWRLANEVYDHGKPVAAICHASTTLANAGLLGGKRCTGWPSEREAIMEKGGNYTGKGVEVDQRIVTAKGPDDAARFAEEIIKLLGGEKPEREALERHKEGEGQHRRKGRGLY